MMATISILLALGVIGWGCAIFLAKVAIDCYRSEREALKVKDGKVAGLKEALAEADHRAFVAQDKIDAIEEILRPEAEE